MAPSEITLYTTRTPNGIKASIALAELGLEYKVRTRFWTRPFRTLRLIFRVRSYTPSASRRTSKR